jgi:RNA polymerase sigma-70 factor (ECF subfamily)
MEQADRERLDMNMARLASGDRSAFDDVFARLLPVFTRFARRLLPDDASADEAAQAALLRLFARASRYDRSRDALAWAMAFAANEVRTHRREEMRRARREGEAGSVTPPGPPGLAEDPEATLLRVETERAIARSLDALGEPDRRTVLEALGVLPRDSALSAAAWRKRWQRARGRLRDALKAEGAES